MTYKETLEFLFSQLPAYHRIGKAAYKGNLDITIALDNYFGNPHRKYPTIHVAGTNGKGSVSHLTASVLQQAGLKTGLYTSPHLRDFRERIKVDGKMIPENSVIDFTERHKQIFARLKPSFFEMTVAMAFDYFAEEAVDVAVIEVGLGGRLDSTNIITPVLSLITNIGHDHMDLLGDTPEKIAFEKAGIIKKNVPVVISETQPLVKDVFLTKAASTGSQISFADERYSCKFEENHSRSGERRYTMTDLVNHREHEGISVLSGDYQVLNLQAVFGLFLNLKSLFRISESHITDGIRNVVLNTGLAGRWQILNPEPLTICDTGHNREGLEFVIDQINKISKSTLHMVVGFVNDKDLAAVLPLFPVDAVYYFTKAAVPRALNEEVLRKEAAAYGLNGQSYPDVSSALSRALENAGKNDVVFIGGSTFIVAEVV
jgi:dihydrofolate synthase / folylpolyglutamate synthase